MSITTTRDGEVVTLTLDDGKVNAMTPAFFTRLEEALDEAQDAGAVVLAGRDGMFSAGLDKRTLEAASDDELHDLLVGFGRTMLRVWLEPLPVVVAATGHAVAGGTILALAADHAVAADGDDYRWGFVETRIGFPMPQWVIALARANMPADRLDDLLLPGGLLAPPAAVEAGLADVVVPPGEVLEAARARAVELAGLPRAAYAATKRRLRGPAASTALDAIAADTAELLAARR